MPEFADVIDRFTLCTDARQLGCKPRYEETGFDCLSRFNSHLAGHATDPQYHNLLGIAGGWWEVSGEVLIPELDGGGIVGTAAGLELLGYDELASSTGALSRVVSTAGYVAGQPVIGSSAAGAKISDFFIQGRGGATRAAILADQANWADIGLLVRDRDTRYNGSHWIGNLAIGACQSGLVLGETRTGNNGDFNDFGALRFNHCVTGIESRCEQQVSNRFGLVIGFGCTNVIHAKQGGNWEIAHLYYGLGSLTQGAALKIGDDTNGTTQNQWTPNADKWDIGQLTLDGSVTTAKAIDVVGFGFGTINVNQIHFPQDYAVDGAITVRSGMTVNIYGGGPFHNGSIKFIEDTTNDYWPTVNLYGCKLLSGASETGLVSQSSNGRGSLGIYGMSNYNGKPFGSGRMRYHSEQLWTGNGATAAITTNWVPTYTS